MSVCPGPCNAAWRDLIDAHLAAVDACHCAAAWLAARPDHRGPPPPLPDIPNPHPFRGEPIWCRRCRALLQRRLTELTYLPDTPRLALDPDSLLSWAQEWEDAGRRTVGVTTRPKRDRTWLSLATSLAWLAAHSDAVLADPDLGGRFGDEVLRLHGLLRQEITAALVAGRGAGAGPGHAR